MSKQKTDVIVPKRSVVQLTADINAEHGAVQEAVGASTAHARSSIQHARNAGALLVEVREQLGHGSFGAWMEESLTFSRRTAYAYIEIAENWATLLPNVQRAAHLTVRSAFRLLAAPPEEEEAETSPQEENESEGADPAQTNGLFEDGPAEHREEEGTSEETEDEETSPKKPMPRHPHSERINKWLLIVMGEMEAIRAAPGGLQELLLERSKWDWHLVQEIILPTIDDLRKSLLTLRKEIKDALK